MLVSSQGRTHYSFRKGKERRERIKEFLSQHFKTKTTPPTLREVGVAVGLTSASTIHKHLSVLEKEGFLVKREVGACRSIELADKSQTLQASVQALEDLERFKAFSKAVLCWLEKKQHLFPHHEQRETQFFLKRGRAMLGTEDTDV